jgi:hypothetical protein
MDAWNGFEEGQFLWLLANTPSERTWVVRKPCPHANSEDSREADNGACAQQDIALPVDASLSDPDAQRLRKHQRVA